MKQTEFINWLRGFVDAAHSYNITPKQWEILVEKLNSVSEDKDTTSFPIQDYYSNTREKTDLTV